MCNMGAYPSSLVRDECSKHLLCATLIFHRVRLPIEIALPSVTPTLRIESIAQHSDLAPAIPARGHDDPVAVKGVGFMREGEGVLHGCGRFGGETCWRRRGWNEE